MSRSKPAYLLHIRLNSCRIQLIKSGVSFQYIAIVACPELIHCSQRCVQLFQSTGWVNKGESHPVLRCHKEHGTITDQLVCLRMSVACGCSKVELTNHHSEKNIISSPRCGWRVDTREEICKLCLELWGRAVEHKSCLSNWFGFDCRAVTAK